MLHSSVVHEKKLTTRLHRHFWKGSKLTAMILKFPISLAKVPLIHRSHVSLATSKFLTLQATGNENLSLLQVPFLEPNSKRIIKKTIPLWIGMYNGPQSKVHSLGNGRPARHLFTFHGVVMSNAKFPL